MSQKNLKIIQHKKFQNFLIPYTNDQKLFNSFLPFLPFQIILCCQMNCRFFVSLTLVETDHYFKFRSISYTYSLIILTLLPPFSLSLLLLLITFSSNPIFSYCLHHHSEKFTPKHSFCDRILNLLIPLINGNFLLIFYKKLTIQLMKAYTKTYLYFQGQFIYFQKANQLFAKTKPIKNTSMQFTQQKKVLPFEITQIPKKQKKKSILSQKMKQRKQRQKIDRQKQGKKISRHNESSDDQYISHKRAKTIQPPQLFDHINYITLEEFQGMLQDERTLQTYYNAIIKNSHIFANRIVLHLTSGCNCYYSIYAAQAGAAKVYCVVNGHTLSEQQNIWMMQQIIKENQLEKVIQVLSWKDFNAQVDVILGEPMGFCMHFDGMLDRMIQARDLFLDKKTGFILPDKLKLKCAFIHDEHFFDKKVKFWNCVYGIPMTSMQKWISHQPIVKIIDPSLIVSEIHKFLEFDLNSITYQQIEEVQTQFSLQIMQDTEVNGLSIWFEIQFNCEGEKSQLKASPWQNPTKLTHVTLYSSKKLEFKAQEKVNIKIYGKKYPHHGVSVMKVSIADEVDNLYTFSD